MCSTLALATDIDSSGRNSASNRSRQGAQTNRSGRSPPDYRPKHGTHWNRIGKKSADVKEEDEIIEMDDDSAESYLDSANVVNKQFKNSKIV
jgi:hypothetical protein